MFFNIFFQYKALASFADIEEKKGFYLQQNSVINIPMSLFVTFMSIFSIVSVTKLSVRFWQLKKRVLAVFLIIFVMISFFVVKFALHLFLQWVRFQVSRANTLPFLIKIPKQKFDDPDQELKRYLKEEMFYTKDSSDNIMKLYNQIKFSYENNLYLKILVSGDPGVGKTRILSKIGSLVSNGAIVLKLSAFLQYEDFHNIDMEQEIDRIDEIIDMCAKNNYLLILDDAELFLTERKYTTYKSGDNPYGENEDMETALTMLIGIWSNHWLSMISAQRVNMIIVSNAMHTVKNTMDAANARRINNNYIINLPNAEERHGIFKRYLKGFHIPGENEDIIQEFVRLTEGFSGRHIRKICLQARISSSIKNQGNILYPNEIISLIKNVDDIQNRQNDKKKEERGDLYLAKIKKLLNKRKRKSSYKNIRKNKKKKSK